MLIAVREELDRIEKFLMRQDQASADLANMLTMLRSEDGSDERDREGSKRRLTMPLRTLMFPELRKAAFGFFDMGERGWAFDTWSRTPAAPEARGRIDERESHFNQHVRMVLEAINRTDPAPLAEVDHAPAELLK